MADPAAIASSLALILPSIQSRLRLVTGFPPERVTLWLGDADPPHLQADQDIVIRPAGMNPDQPWWIGGGPFTCRVIERVDVQIRTRLSLDPTGSAAVWFLDATLGHLHLRNLVLLALVGGTGGFLPNDGVVGAENVYVSCPLRFMSGRMPRTDRAKSNESVTDWGSETLTFEVDYLQDVYDVNLTELTMEAP